MATVNQKLGEKIRQFRRSKGLTQDELAYRSKTDLSYINEIEAGKRNPSVKRVDKIARALGVALSDLFKY